jgi:hypothetical protein
MWIIIGLAIIVVGALLGAWAWHSAGPNGRQGRRLRGGSGPVKPGQTPTTDAQAQDLAIQRNIHTMGPGNQGM